MTALIPFLFIAIFALVVVAIVFGHMGAKKRREELAAWARSRDWHYAEGEVSSLEDRFPSFGQLRQGDNRYGFNVMRGRVGHRRAHAFDYHYQTYSTDSKGRRQTHHHEFSAVVVDSGLELTNLALRPEGIFDKMKGLFGVDDIDFESVEFSKAFWVTSPEKRWAYDVLHQETMEYILDGPRFHLEFEDGPYVIALLARKFKAPDFDDALAFVDGILDRIPKDIRKELHNRADYPPPL
ncbi:MAG: hypothetical protein P1V36_11115 [Planctomycetota bacterium]|nr:hypothetical protein [Planctomycetota bacterium]